MSLRFSMSLLMGLALFMTGGLAVNADTVIGGTLTAWTGTLGTAASPTYGGAYWNNSSGDYPAPSTGNVGWCLAGGGNCTLPGGPVGTPQYYSNGGAAPANMYFTGNTSGAGVTTLLVSITSQKGIGGGGLDSLYYYLTSSSGVPNLASRTFLFNAGAPSMTSAVLSIPTGDGYGFELVNAQPGGQTFSYFMNDTLNAPGDATQHFAIFQQSTSSFYIGAEDGAIPGSDLDYNDMVIHLQTAVPEPASLGLLGGGFLLVGAFVRRRSRRTAGK